MMMNARCRFVAVVLPLLVLCSDGCQREGGKEVATNDRNQGSGISGKAVTEINGAHMKPERFSFQHAGNTLVGDIHFPAGRGPFPVVVLIHGSGPASRNGYGYYPRLGPTCFEVGFATVSWDKPGVGESTGDWHGQSMRDRADEAVAAIEALRIHPKVDPKRIGLWGISQAGWVMPMIAANTDLAFMIAISTPVGTGAEQDVFLTERQVLVHGYSSAEAARAVAFAKRRLELAMEEDGYEACAALQAEIAKEHWCKHLAMWDQRSFQFVRRQRDDCLQYDPKPMLRRVRCPILAVFGTLDTVVDTRESVAFYAELSPGNPDVTVRLIDHADHALFASVTGSVEEMEKMFRDASHAKFGPGYPELMGEWLAARFR
jgi:uncharacterized protein